MDLDFERFSKMFLIASNVTMHAYRHDFRFNLDDYYRLFLQASHDNDMHQASKIIWGEWLLSLKQP